MDFCRLNACFGVSRSYCMGVLAFVWGTEAYNGEICDFFFKKVDGGALSLWVPSLATFVNI